MTALTHGYAKLASVFSGINFNGLGTSLIAPGDGSKPDFTIILWARNLTSFGFRTTVGARLMMYWDGLPGNQAVIEFRDDSLTLDVSVGLPVGALTGSDWHFIACRHAGDVASLFFDGALVDSASTTTWTPLLADPNSGWLMADIATVQSAANFAVFDRALTSDEIFTLYVAGLRQDYRDPFLAWSGEVPPLYLRDADLSNAGDGGAIAASFVSGASAIDLTAEPAPSEPETTTTSVRRIGTVAGPMYPPIRTYYTLPGTTNGGLRAIGSRLPRLAFPSAGGVGNFSWRGWIRRPTSPAQADGTLLGIHIGDISIRVTISIGNLLGVTVDDGTSDETDTAVTPLPELSWVAVSMAVADDGSVVLYVGDTVYASLDISTLSFPDEDGQDTSYTIGTDIGGTDPIDLDIKGIANWDVALTPEEVAALVPKGPDFDVRNTDPVTPAPVEYWIEPIDGVVPGVEEPLIPMSEDVLDEIEPSDINLWASGDHRLGIYSSAWWDGTALDPASWSLAFLDSSLEDSFGEAPRIVVVTVRSDGALTLDLDARMMPGVSYELTGPDDLSGTPTPTEFVEE